MFSRPAAPQAATPAKTPSRLNPTEQKKAVSIMSQIIRQAASQSRKDIEDWKGAKRSAENPDRPSRKKLMEIYYDSVIDGHLKAQMNNRIMRVTNKKFKVVNRKTKQEDPVKTELLQTKWFKTFVWHAMEAIFFGYSLIEFNPPGLDGCFNSVKLVFREHVLPDRLEVLVRASDERGISFAQPPFSHWHIGVGDQDDLGLLLELSLFALMKKNTWASWGEFEEMFGVPIRTAETASADPKVKGEIQDWMEEMGRAAYGVFPEGTKLQIHNSGQGDAFQVFEQKRKACNEEISKLINGQTMTSDNGSSRSQSETHALTEDQITQDDMDDIHYLVNDDLLPFLIMHGYPFTPDDVFEWDQQEELKLLDRWTIDNGILTHFDVDPTYIEETYGVKVLSSKKAAGAAPDGGQAGKK
jgi:phage gp29-like protein